ncbi:MAG: DNA alkylation repair protein [Acidobacteriota bacterium]|nr:DNA alkylation repair protein [Acidobacteriota bacterium]
MAEPLKNVYSSAFIDRLAGAVATVWRPFDKTRFTNLVFDEDWPARELKDRMQHIAVCLNACLPRSYREALHILNRTAPAFGGFEAMFFPAFVETYGLYDWEASLPALAHLTRFSSSEFAVRPFIKADTPRMMAQMTRWAEDENLHVRRLASEGCRPRLPWAVALPQFKADPSPVLPVLERLKADPEEYVRRSVANNLNDIAKDHPVLVLDIAERWLGSNRKTDRVVKHACRSLLKAGNPRAMRLFGFGDPAAVTVTTPRLDKERVPIGATLGFRFNLCLGGNRPEKLRVEYAVDYLKAGGKHNRKVFKIGEKIYPPGETEVARNQSFQQRTTRKHYPGPHFLAVIINGVEKTRIPFEVI